MARVLRLCLLPALFFCAAGLAADDRPNIVFILADDLGYGDLGVYGHPYAQTPHLDKLASEGTAFKRFYVTGITCSPSRTGFMTSRHPATFANTPPYHGFGDRPTVTDLFNKAGYRVGHIGKWHIGPDESDGTYGIHDVQVIGPSRQHRNGRDGKVFDAAVAFVQANKDEPFYLNVWAHISHAPVDPFLKPDGPFSDLTVDRSDFAEPMQDKFDDAEDLGGNLDTAMRNYLTEIHYLDVAVGELLKAIEDAGLADNTIVVFSSDQGPAPVILRKKKPGKTAPNMLGYAGGLRGGKHDQYEGGVRAPFIIRWPGQVPAGKVNATSITSALDWLPTLASIAGIDYEPELFEGEVVRDIWAGSNRSRANPLFWKRWDWSAEVTVLEGNWKLFADRNKQYRLYDLGNDPGESTDVSRTHADVVAALLRKLNAWNAGLPRTYTK